MYRRYDNRRKPESATKAIVSFCGLCFLLYSFGGPAARGFFGWMFAIVIGLIFLRFIYKNAKVSGFRDLNHVASQNASIAAAVPTINAEKHGCRCFLEGLNESEQVVARVLSRDLSYKEYFLFNNLIIPFQDVGSTQIDHVVISKFGVFVIETKDRQGWIFGGKQDSYWTESLPGGKRKFQFQNPIHQNYAHIMGLNDLLGLPIESFRSVVVFSNRSTFKSGSIEGVLRLAELIDFIKSNKIERLTENEVQLAIGKLSFVCQTGDISLSQHIANLHASHPISS